MFAQVTSMISFPCLIAGLAANHFLPGAGWMVALPLHTIALAFFFHDRRRGACAYAA
ncbi:hypothetical protein OCH239_09310 [Roseivivax halodurans JCM 10272]|uniref:Uncharacterized protein n=1 Tax=Roseivivax halodurans JCM 10272 TaxID=1449350 RepID=X7EEU6_9RHOB|nr:hypothetical protein [Roseivivax halodurans]ETX13653.1 hypothetical protein OCH239_09310 [Roseivivax halodurans JCM 10272]